MESIAHMSSCDAGEDSVHGLVCLAAQLAFEVSGAMRGNVYTCTMLSLVHTYHTNTSIMVYSRTSLVLCKHKTAHTHYFASAPFFLNTSKISWFSSTLKYVFTYSIKIPD